MKRMALDFICMGEPWAITSEGMDTILNIAQRKDLDPEALATKLGHPLDNAHSVHIQNGIAIVPIQGPIFPKANLFTEISGATSLEQLAQDIVAATENSNINGIALTIHSPGGQTTMVHEAQAIIRATQKPIFAYVEGQAASAAFLLASAADKIILDPMALVGSIGTVLGVPPKREDGAIEIVSSQSPNKRPDPGTETGRSSLQTIVDDLAQVFIDTVAENRNLSTDHVASLKGGMLVGQKAIDFGLADALGTLDSVIAELSTCKPKRKHPMTATTEKPITSASIKTEHPDVYQAIYEEGKAAGFTAGKAKGAQTPDPAKWAPVEAMAHLQADVAALRAAATARAVDDLINPALADGRLLPFQEEWARNLAAASPESLATFLSTAVPIPALTSQQTGGKPPEEFTADMAREFGEELAYKAFKRAEAEGLVSIRQ